MFARNLVLPETTLPEWLEIKRNGQKLAKLWTVQPGAFLKANNCSKDITRSAASFQRALKTLETGSE